MDATNAVALGIDKDALRRALAELEAQARAGLTRSAEEARALPVEQVADEGADALWGLLLRDQQNSTPQVLCNQEQVQKAFYLFLVLIKEQGADDVAASGALPTSVVAQRMQGYLWRLLVEKVRFDSRRFESQGGVERRVWPWPSWWRSRRPEDQGGMEQRPDSQTNT